LDANNCWMLLCNCSSLILLRSESLSGKCAKLHTVAATNNRDHMSWSPYYCWFAPHIYIVVVLHAQPIRAESHIQCNANGEVATTIPPLNNERHQLHVPFVKVAPGTTFTSWSQHHFVATGKPKRKVRRALHCGSKQQQRSHAMITLLLLVRAKYIWVLFFTHIPFAVNHTFNATPTERLQQYHLYKSHITCSKDGAFLCSTTYLELIKVAMIILSLIFYIYLRIFYYISE